MIKWLIRKYNKAAEEIRAELNDKPLWLVRVRLIDNSEIGVEYRAHGVEEVKVKYSRDVKVYNGLIIGSGANRKYIKKNDIARVVDIVLVDTSVVSVVGEDEEED